MVWQGFPLLSPFSNIYIEISTENAPAKMCFLLRFFNVASSRVQENGYYVSLRTSSRGCWKTVYSYSKNSFRYPNIVFVCIIRLTCPCEGTIAKCDFGIGLKSAETPPPNNS